MGVAISEATLVNYNDWPFSSVTTREARAAIPSEIASDELLAVFTCHM